VSVGSQKEAFVHFAARSISNAEHEQCLCLSHKVRPAIPVRVLAPKPKSTFKYPGPLTRYI